MHDVEVVRALIDAAKERAAERDAEPIHISLGAVELPVKRSRPRAEKDTDTIDPSNVHVLDNASLGYIPALVARLIEVRAAKRQLNTEEDAIKDVLMAEVGELEYIALAEGERPIVSMKHEERTTVNTGWVHENLPAAEHPEAWRKSSSRPLRIVD